MGYPRYQPPEKVVDIELDQLLRLRRNQPPSGGKQRSFDFNERRLGEEIVFYAGDLDLVKRPCVAIVGARKATAGGKARARKVARELSDAGVVVVSGLAMGIDTAAQHATVDYGGKTIAVVGTPLDTVTPQSNTDLQQLIYREHLLLSPFAIGKTVRPANFPRRNRLMANVADATVIIEASDTSGTLHQAAECTKLGRWLFIARACAEDTSLSWPQKFLAYDTVTVLKETTQVLERIRS